MGFSRTIFFRSCIQIFRTKHCYKALYQEGGAVDYIIQFAELLASRITYSQYFLCDYLTGTIGLIQLLIIKKYSL